MKITLHLHQVTEDVIDFTLDPKMDTEVRIASYLTVIHCANDTHLENILNAMITEENTQGKEDYLRDCGLSLML